MSALWEFIDTSLHTAPGAAGFAVGVVLVLFWAYWLLCAVGGDNDEPRGGQWK